MGQVRYVIINPMKKQPLKLLFRCLFLFALFANSAFASTLEIGRMRVAIWPEHDDPGILVIYDGRFVDKGSFPAKTTFMLPKGAVISDACSLSPRGQHFCQLFKQESVGDSEKVDLKLPYPNFYLSFHLPSQWEKGAERKWTHTVRVSHAVKKLEIDLQEPLRTEGFSVTPKAEEVEVVKDFTHHRYSFADQRPGARLPLEISYKKRDDRPSVDIKYSRMSESGGVKAKIAPHEERGRFMIALYALAGMGLLLVAGLLWVLLAKKGKE